MGSKSLLGPEESKRIEAAVSAAEEQSGGEIVVAMIPESDDYGFRELLFAVVVGVLCYNLALLFYGPLDEYLNTLFWGYNSLIPPLTLGMIALVGGAIAYFLAQLPLIDRLIIPKRVMAEAVARRARRYFVESGAYDTLDQTGILIFVSVLERRVELIADRGINAKVPGEAWNSIVADLTRGLAGREVAVALERAINACGTILAENIDRRQNDANELPDTPDELERGT